MPKKKKTRKQKILADKRQVILKAQFQKSVNQVSNFVAERSTQPRLKQDQRSSIQEISSSQYKYLYSDLIKTVVLTVSIVVGELLLAYSFIWRSII